MKIDPLKEQLALILQQSADSAREGVLSRLGELRPTADSTFILFGCGELGRATLSFLRNAGMSVLAFCDNNPKRWGSRVDGVPVISPTEGAERCGGSTLLVMTVFTNAPMRKQLESMGVKALSFAELAWCYPDSFLPYQSVELPDKIIQNSTQVLEGLDLWADEVSRREYLGQIAWRMSLDPSVQPPHLSATETYFPDDLFQLGPDEVFVDCGAFDGDSIRPFLVRTGGSFKQIIAIEPDASNFKHLENALRDLNSDKVKLIQQAVGDHRNKIRFAAMGTVASSIGEGGSEVDCVILDELLDGAIPSLIKMDIEGAEPAALRGGAGAIAKHYPVLIICLYHAQEHLWEIPFYLRQIAPEYHLFLRRYSDENWEQVCYAVPKRRSLNPVAK